MTTTAPGYNISAQEAARRLAVSVRTLGRMEKDGRLKPVTRLGGYRKFDAEQVDRVRRGLPAQP